MGTELRVSNELPNKTSVRTKDEGRVDKWGSFVVFWAERADARPFVLSWVWGRDENTDSEDSSIEESESRLKTRYRYVTTTRRLQIIRETVACDDLIIKNVIFLSKQNHTCKCPVIPTQSWLWSSINTVWAILAPVVNIPQAKIVRIKRWLLRGSFIFQSIYAGAKISQMSPARSAERMWRKSTGITIRSSNQLTG